MEKIYQIFKARPKLAIGISVGIIFLIILIFILPTRKTPASQIKRIPTSVPSQLSSLSPTISTFEELVTPTPMQKTHLAADYEIVYPSDWNEQNMTVVGGGTTILLMPRDKREDEFFPRFKIEVTPLLSKEGIEKKAADLGKMYQLQLSLVSFRDTSAIMLDGTLHLQWVTGNPDQKPVHKTVLFFSRGNYTYVIEYAYFEDQNASEFASILDKMLASFHFRK